MTQAFDGNWAEAARFEAEEGFLHRFLRVLAARPDAPAILAAETGAVWNYRELADRAAAIRGGLSRLGIGAGDRVLIMLHNSAELVAALLAVTAQEAVAVLLNPAVRPFELEPMLADAQPRGYLCEAGLAPLTVERLAALCPQAGLCLRGELPGVPALTALAAAALPLQAPAGNPEVTCHFTYKGLGYPLGVVHRYHDYSASIAGCAELMGVAPGARHLVMLPMHAVFSLVVSVLYPLAHGATLVLARPRPGALLELLEQHRIQYACLVRELILGLLRAVRRQGDAKLHPHLLLVGGGSYLEPALIEEVRQALGVDLYQGYGTSETLPAISNSPYQHKPASLGLPTMPGIQVAILDHAGSNLPPGEVGEICLAGSSVARRYLNRPQETQQFFARGWFRSGDLGYRDWRGYVHFVSRRMAFTKVQAQMVDLLEVQRALETHPRVRRARVQAREREAGQVLEAALLVAAGVTLEAGEVRRFLGGLLSPHKIPKRIRLIEESVSA